MILKSTQERVYTNLNIQKYETKRKKFQRSKAIGLKSKNKKKGVKDYYLNEQKLENERHQGSKGIRQWLINKCVSKYSKII